MNLQNSPIFYSKIIVAQMTSEFSSIKQGLVEAIDYFQGKPKKAIVHEFGPIDVKNIRAKVGMSQS